MAERLQQIDRERHRFGDANIEQRALTGVERVAVQAVAGNVGDQCTRFTSEQQAGFLETFAGRGHEVPEAASGHVEQRRRADVVEAVTP